MEKSFSAWWLLAINPAYAPQESGKMLTVDESGSGVASGQARPYVFAMSLTKEETERLQARVLQRLISHLQGRTDVQNIDLMNLAGFCRNCLSNWMEDAAKQDGLELSRDEARQQVYGMPYEEWKKLHQKDASASQLKAFESNKPKH